MGSAIGYSLMGAQMPLMILRPDYIVVLATASG